VFTRACHWSLFRVPSSPHLLTIFSKIHSNIIILSIPRPSEWSLPFHPVNLSTEWVSFYACSVLWYCFKYRG
jgi:hypothetical protein